MTQPHLTETTCKPATVCHIINLMLLELKIQYNDRGRSKATARTFPSSTQGESPPQLVSIQMSETLTTSQTSSEIYCYQSTSLHSPPNLPCKTVESVSMQSPPPQPGSFGTKGKLARKPSITNSYNVCPSQVYRTSHLLENKELDAPCNSSCLPGEICGGSPCGARS